MTLMSKKLDGTMANIFDTIWRWIITWYYTLILLNINIYNFYDLLENYEIEGEKFIDLLLNLEIADIGNDKNWMYSFF